MPIESPPRLIPLHSESEGRVQIPPRETRAIPIAAAPISGVLSTTLELGAVSLHPIRIFIQKGETNVLLHNGGVITQFISPDQCIAILVKL